MILVVQAKLTIMPYDERRNEVSKVTKGFWAERESFAFALGLER
jgi:hypothetical protein